MISDLGAVFPNEADMFVVFSPPLSPSFQSSPLPLLLFADGLIHTAFDRVVLSSLFYPQLKA